MLPVDQSDLSSRRFLRLRRGSPSRSDPKTLPTFLHQVLCLSLGHLSPSETISFFLCPSVNNESSQSTASGKPLGWLFGGLDTEWKEGPDLTPLVCSEEHRSPISFLGLCNTLPQIWWLEMVEMYCLTVLEARSREAMYGQGHTPEASGRESPQRSPACNCAAPAFFSFFPWPWFLRVPRVFSFSVSYKGPVIAFGAHPNQYGMVSFQDPFLNYLYSTKTHILRLHIDMSGGIIYLTGGLQIH